MSLETISLDEARAKLAEAREAYCRIDRDISSFWDATLDPMALIGRCREQAYQAWIEAVVVFNKLAGHVSRNHSGQ